MATSEAQKKAVMKYKRTNYARLELTIRPSEKEKIKSAAAACGQSVNAYILQSVQQRMRAEQQQGEQVQNSPNSATK